jgi:tRNA (adenine57-N1/adenine58-N1)-methyltransferase
VQKTCEALADDGFEAISTLEVLLKVHDVRTAMLPLPDFGTDRPLEIPTDTRGPLFSKTTMPLREMAGHTGYFTFATKPRV